MMTYKIKPGDIVTLKTNLERYCAKRSGFPKGEVRELIKKECCKDPSFILAYDVRNLLSDRKVNVIDTGIKTLWDKNQTVTGMYYYLKIAFEFSGVCYEFKIPIEFISKSYALYRNNKRLTLANKTLIC